MVKEQKVDNLFDLTGKKAIVTGAAQGLGKAMAQGLNRYGCEIVVLDLNKEIDRIAGSMAGREAPCMEWSVTSRMKTA